MKKLFFKLLSLSFAISFVLFASTACGGNEEDVTPHEHTFEDVWSYDGEYHFKKASCEHTEETEGKSKHSFANNACTVCGCADESLGLAFSLNDGGDSYCIDGRGTNTETNLVIPSTYKNKPVKKIAANAFRDSTDIVSVTLPDGLTELGFGAFYGCTSLTSIEIPSGVTAIPDSAFVRCLNLTTVTFGNNVKSIGSSSFSDCFSLKNVTLPNSLEKIGTSAFYKCTSFTELVIPNNVTSIGYASFENCFGLMKLTLGENVESIDKSAFNNCYRLVEIINNSQKMNVSKHNDLNYGSLGYYAIKVFNVGDEYYNIFSTDDDGYVTFPGTIGRILISYLGNETELTLPSDIIEINQGAFYGNSNLTSVVVGENVTKIGERVFCECENLTTVTLGEKVSSIGQLAFDKCNKLTNVFFENTVNWYEAESKLAWINKSGTNADVTDASANAAALKDAKKAYWWYKK